MKKTVKKLICEGVAVMLVAVPLMVIADLFGGFGWPEWVLVGCAGALGGWFGPVIADAVIRRLDARRSRRSNPD